MKSLKPADLRDKTVPELEELVKSERASLYKARRDLVFRQMTDTASLKVRRKNVARILTLIAEKKRGGES
jgi:large subunit ribosomal protein L29